MGVLIDLVGNVFACALYSLGGVCWPLSRSVVVALAWCLGCRSGCRSWNDSTSGTRHRRRCRCPYSMYKLPQTLSRLHVCATLVLAQVIGSICVMVARATAPNAIGPGTVFPNVGTWDFSQGISGSPMAAAPFWIALICQIIIVLGYFWFYRKEQLGMCSFVFFSLAIVLTRASLHSPAITRTCTRLPSFFSSLFFAPGLVSKH